MSQNLDALATANEIRIEAARQRRSLIGKPISVVLPAIIDPTPELAALKLRTLFIPFSASGLIPRVGPIGLDRVFSHLANENPHGRQDWHTELRLRDLTQPERRRLARALVRQAPSAWREAA